ncbi:ADP,ATP carrier protein 1, chloroplastic-like [Salvia miltiorrhiza]|uniref:ADP,ATP carrier protein 1, chloroplastic-like n=1 Tax=Salvia miltiorrhiza TaxID=226208 RepID=UPI0025AB5F77|nr:ADP,ATP carrier protein 1, chloroplastic-like [Salvia miltiorrhiza]
MSSYIHPTTLADNLLNILGPRFLGPLAILRIWSFCLFYVMAELWGSVVVSVLFWGFANQITTVDEAKKFYPLFGLGANVVLIFSGRTVKYFSKLRENLGPGVDGWAVSLKGMMSIVVLMGLVICFLYWWVNHNVPLLNFEQNFLSLKAAMRYYHWPHRLLVEARDSGGGSYSKAVSFDMNMVSLWMETR